jgi:uncharacterized Fe-S center protein
MVDVSFLRYTKDKNILEGLESLFMNSLLDVVSKGDSVAVKLHMGELGNLTYIRPAYVRKVVELIKKVGGKPFVTDTTSLYTKKRFTGKGYLEAAAYNGFTKETVAAPIVIADKNGYDGSEFPIDKKVDECGFESIKIASALLKADSIITITHVKGHELTGFGGSLKNIGMGFVTKEGKAAQHSANRPILDKSKCSGCGICIEECVFKALSMQNGKPKMDLEKCMSCSNCMFECPNKAWKWPDNSKEKLQSYLAHAVYGILNGLKSKIGYLNFIQDVTPLCDCCTPSGKALIQDIGILTSLDPVAIDKASIDLIDKEMSGPFWRKDKIGKLNKTSSLIHLKTAEKLGVGSLRYRLVEV